MGSGVPARAQMAAPSACPAAFPVIASADATLRRQELANLQQLTTACLQRADFYAYQGQLLLLQERFVDALVALERSLLLDATQLGVQLDYAIALAQTGDIDSARALAQQVLEGKDAPPAMRKTLEAILRSEQQPASATSRWQWRGSVQSLLGLDSNLNSATSADAINLTLPNGNVSLLLDASSKPRSGAASITAGHLLAQTGLDRGLLVVQADWRERLAPGNSEFGYRQQDASLLYKSHNAEDWAGRLAVSSFSMGHASLFTGQTLTAWKEFSHTDCTLRAGLETEHRTYAQDDTQNGIYGSAFGAFLCAKNQNNFQLGIQAGKDWAAHATRAGGNQTRLDLKASWDRQWPWARTSAEWVASQLQDANPYSDLLGGVTRATLRQNLRISVIKRLNSQEKSNSWGGWYSVSVFEMLRHNSNINLFDVRSQSLYTGLRYEF
jgi:hypothetical protein